LVEYLDVNEENDCQIALYELEITEVQHPIFYPYVTVD
jgi:hypothetical protein